MAGDYKLSEAAARMICLDLVVAVYDLFGDENVLKAVSKQETIEALVRGRKKVISHTTVAHLLAKAHSRFDEVEMDAFFKAVKVLFSVAPINDEGCKRFAGLWKDLPNEAAITENRAWTATVCHTHRVEVFADSVADYIELVPRRAIVTWPPEDRTAVPIV